MTKPNEKLLQAATDAWQTFFKHGRLDAMEREHLALLQVAPDVGDGIREAARGFGAKLRGCDPGRINNLEVANHLVGGPRHAHDLVKPDTGSVFNLLQWMRQGCNLSLSDFMRVGLKQFEAAIIEAYGSPDEGQTAWCRRDEVPDFTDRTKAAGLMAAGLLKTGEHGEIRAGDLHESSEALKVETYARIYRLTLQRIVNGDFDVLREATRAIAGAVRRLEASLAFGAISGNPNLADAAALFSTTRGNQASSAAALSKTTLGAAYGAMRSATLNDETLEAMPRYVLTAPAKAVGAGEVVREIRPPEGAPMLSVIDSPHLSGTGWYLAADPATAPLASLAKLRNQPDVGDLRLFNEFNRQSLSISIRADRGAIPLLPGAGYYNAGA